MSHPPSIDPLNTFSRHILDDPSIERIYKVPREDFEGVWGVDPGDRGGVLAAAAEAYEEMRRSAAILYHPAP